MAGEDVENELGAVDDAAGQPGFEVAQLRWRQVVVEEDQVGTGGGDGCLDLIDLALADEGGGVRPRSALGEDGGNGGSGAAGELLKLG